MRNVHIIRMEPGLIWIPLGKTVLCKNYRTVSTSVARRCGLCGSEQISRLADEDSDPSGSGSPLAGARAA